MSTISFENLPQAVSELLQKVGNLEKLIGEHFSTQHLETELVFLNLEQASLLLNLAKQTIYGLVSKNEIPFYKKGKKLHFIKSELLDWLKAGKHKTNCELEKEAEAYLNNLKKGKKNG